jgi:hypothetical protein
MLKVNALKLSAIVIGGCIFGLVATPAQAENPSDSSPTPAPAVTLQSIPTTVATPAATPAPSQLIAQEVTPQPVNLKPKFQREMLNCRIFAAATMQQ